MHLHFEGYIILENDFLTVLKINKLSRFPTLHVLLKSFKYLIKGLFLI